MSNPGNHPLWMTAQQWLNSSYHELWNPEGRFQALFDLNRNYSSSKVFPIYPTVELMFRLKKGWCYQPYGCGETKWVYVRVVDYSEDLALKSTREVVEQELTSKRYCIYNWWDKKALEDLGIPLTRKTSDGETCGRGSVTHQELGRILEIPSLKEVWDKKQEEALEDLHWHKITPSKETPVVIYAAGGDDSSYTKVYSTIESAMADIERFKKEGLIEDPETENGWIFTN